MKPEERLKLLKKTLKKSTALTEKLLKRLDREWDDIYNEDSEHGMNMQLTSFIQGLIEPICSVYLSTRYLFPL